jgi:uncharacterized protein
VAARLQKVLITSIFEVGSTPVDFEWDSAEEQSNHKNHGVDFRTGAKVFLDPYVIEFDDRDAAGELRFNAIGMVDGRVLFVAYTMRGPHPHHIRPRSGPA